MRALHVVVGAGALGRALLKAVASAGHRARLLDVHSVPLQVPLGVEVRRGPISSGIWIEEACAGAQVVYDALELKGRNGERVRAAVRAGAEASDARWVRLEQLEAAQAEDPDERLEGNQAIGRVGDLFGGGWDQGVLSASALQRLERDRRVTVPGNPDLPHTWAYLPDVARALVTLGGTPAAGAQAWHLPAADAITTRELLRLGCEAAGRPGAMPRLTIKQTGQSQVPFLLEHTRFAEAFGPEAARVTRLEAAIRAALKGE